MGSLGFYQMFWIKCLHILRFSIAKFFFLIDQLLFMEIPTPGRMCCASGCWVMG